MYNKFFMENQELLHQLSVLAEEFDNFVNDEAANMTFQQDEKEGLSANIGNVQEMIFEITNKAMKFEPTREKLDHTTTILEKKITEYRGMLLKIRAN